MKIMYKFKKYWCTETNFFVLLIIMHEYLYSRFESKYDNEKQN